MDSQQKRLIFVVVSYMLVSMMTLVVQSTKRKRRAVICYGPIDERDRMRSEYLDNKIWRDETTCVNMLRLGRGPFFRFCKLFRDRKLLEDTIHLSIEQQVAMFLHTIGHNVRNRIIGGNFGRSGEVVSLYFKKVLHAVGELRGDLIRKPSLETQSKIEGNYRWDPYFKDCIGAIDGTHVRASVTKDMEPSFRGRKIHTTQNVMAAVDFDLPFTYVLAGWEGSAHNVLVLRDALNRPNGLLVPQGNFYLVDAGYGAKPGFLPPFRGARYHLNEWGNNPPINEKELFNLRHFSLRTTVERGFGSLKGRFKILDDATPFFKYPTQVDIVVTFCIIHNWVINDGIDEFIIPEDEWVANINHASSSSGQASEHTTMEMEAKQVVWTAPMTSFMLDHLCKVVNDGLRTSTGFKKCQLARCVTAMNEHFQLNLTHANVGNHNRTWRRKWGTIIRLRGLSGALWDDEKSMIVLDHEHYTNHVKAHKEDEPFLNKPLKHYNEMAIIHGNTMATGQYTKGSNDPLGTEVNEISDSEASPLEESSKSNNGGDSVVPNPKRAKTKPSVDEGL